MFTNFQKDYINQYAVHPKWKLGKWSACVLIVTALTTFGLIAKSQASEPFSDNIQNLISFGSNLCVIQHIIAIPLILLGMVVVGGVNALFGGLGALAQNEIKKSGGDQDDVKDVKLIVESNRMKMMRGSSLARLRPTVATTLRKCFRYSLLVALIAGMVLNGYNFSGFVVLVSFVLSLAMAGIEYRRAKNHILTLNYDNVKDMEDQLAKQEANKNRENTQKTARLTLETTLSETRQVLDEAERDHRES